MLIAATHKSSLDKEFIEISDIDSFYCKGYFLSAHLRPILLHTQTLSRIWGLLLKCSIAMLLQRMNGFSRAGSFTIEHKSKVCGTIVATNHIRPQPKPPAFSRQGNYTQSYLPKHSIEWGREPGIHVTYDNIPYFLCSMTSILCQGSRKERLTASNP